MSKRILFDRNPIDEPIRERMRSEASDYIEPFKHRIAMKRRNPRGHPFWDRLWPLSLNGAAQELEIEVVRINGGMFTREAADRDSVRARAEEIWRDLQNEARS